MAPVVVYETYHSTKHVAERCSCAYFWAVMAVVGWVVLPFMITFHTSACPSFFLTRYFCDGPRADRPRAAAPFRQMGCG